MEKEEAIKVIRKNYPHVSSSGSEFETALRAIIPELVESEDERIRKWLIDDIKRRSIGWTHSEFTGEQILAWLEKQKEQKPLSTEETELNSLAFLSQMGYTCIPPKKRASE